MRPLLASLLLLGLLGSPALAKDYEEEARVREADALVAKLAKQIEAKDRAGIETGLKAATSLHNTLKSRPARSRLQKAAARVLGDRAQNVVTRKAAADALGGMFDEKGVWSVLKPHVPSAKTEAVGQVGLAVLRALAQVQASGAISTLERLATSALDPNAARLAIAALGQYSYAKKRTAILKFLIKELTRLRPGNARDVRGRVNTKRYIAVRDALLAALNTLTRRRVEGVEAWLALYKEHAKAPEKLFRTGS